MIKSLLYSLSCVALITVVACGKVTQNPKKETEKPAFTLTYTVPVLTEKEHALSPQSFKVDKPIYAAVWGISEKGKFTQLSWGKGLIKYEDKITKIAAKGKGAEATPEKIEKVKVPKSYAYDARGIELAQSNYKWTKPSYKETSKTWSFTSAKIRRTYPHYIVAVYEDKSRFRLSYFDQEVVSKNNSVSLGKLDLQDTFLASLHLIQLKKDASSALSAPFVKRVITQPFFENSAYTLPQNRVKTFDIKKPEFLIDRKLESVMIDLIDAALVDKQEALLYVDSLDSQLIPTVSRYQLRQAVLRLQTAGSN